jgi:hypothetical protein|tara:strand:- start:174 stop:503 length:330 start_codon:yes stop_codon:yes gene_type:complete
MYALEQGLVDLINAQRAEAEEFSKQEGCFMGKMPEATELKYWAERVPTGTLAEYNRIELEETCYYMLCDAYSKSMARSLRYSVMTDEELEAEIVAAGNMIAMQAEAQCS